MSTPAPDDASLPDHGYHWTTAKARLFLGGLVQFGRVGEAAK